jgi:thioesterase domain-containing protein
MDDTRKLLARLSPEQRELFLLRLRAGRDGAGQTAKTQESSQPSPLVEIQTSGTRAPFFCVHAFGGGVNSYHRLSSHMGEAQPFYGLQARGLDGREEPLRSVEEMAAFYVEAVRVVRPEGPYHLGGWCFGGLVALEMARQLLALGREVELLALIGTVEPSKQKLPERDDSALLVEMLRDNLGLAFDGSGLEHVRLEDLRRLAPDERLVHSLAQLKKHGLVPQGYALSWYGGYFNVYKTNYEALRRYEARAYAERLTLFRAADESDDEGLGEDYGWGRLAVRLEVVNLPCAHSELLKETHVGHLAAGLGERLGG